MGREECLLPALAEACLAILRGAGSQLLVIGADLGWIGPQLLPFHCFHMSRLTNSEVSREGVVWGTFEF